jgi:predicted Rossmann fold nucleotide-binding protein DprA/Smf involved in DNA uptake
MARNRYIHALADATVVIATARESGGTWAGSKDNLDRGWSPLLVWTGPGAPEGNAALVELGGYPFDTAPEDAAEIATLIRRAAEAALERESPESSLTQPQLL